ncbi:hypothetical protein [Rhodanobacter lindaniclasticus]
MSEVTVVSVQVAEGGWSKRGIVRRAPRGGPWRPARIAVSPIAATGRLRRQTWRGALIEVNRVRHSCPLRRRGLSFRQFQARRISMIVLRPASTGLPGVSDVGSSKSLAQPARVASRLMWVLGGIGADKAYLGLAGSWLIASC